MNRAHLSIRDARRRRTGLAARVALLVGFLGCRPHADSAPPAPDAANASAPPAGLSATRPRPPVLPAVTVQVTPNANSLIDSLLALSDPSGPDIADLNQRPIHVWTIGGDNAVSDLYFVGHADGACCPKVSRAVHEAAKGLQLDERWSSFGIGHLAASTPAARAGLAQLAAQIDALAGTEPCEGQLLHHSMATNGVEARTAELARVGTEAYQAAAGAGRTLALWYDGGPDDLALAPVLVPASDGAMKPLEITVPASVFSFPSSVLKRVSADGVAQYIASIREELDRIHKVRRLREQMKGHTRTISSILWTHGTIELNYRAPETGARLAAALNDLLALERALEAERDVIRALGDMLPPTMRTSYKANGRDKALSKVQSALATTRASRTSWNTLPAEPISNSPTRLDFWTAEPTFETSAIDELVPQLDTSRTRIESLEAEERRLRAWKHETSHDPLLSLVDAALRGWPATFTDSRAERAFDRWVGKHQRRVWQAVAGKLREAGAVFGDARDPTASLRASNLVFRVRHEAGAVTIRPLYVLSGSFYMIADPRAHVVRYESATADHNLVSMKDLKP